MNTVPDNDEQVREAVRERYRRTALQVLGAGETTAEECCGGNGCCSNTVVSSTGSQLQASCCGAASCPSQPRLPRLAAVIPQHWLN